MVGISWLEFAQIVRNCYTGGLLGGPRAYQGEFRGFNKSRRVHARKEFVFHKTKH